MKKTGDVGYGRRNDGKFDERCERRKAFNSGSLR